MPRSYGGRARLWLKAAVNGGALLAVTPFALTCWLEAKVGLGHIGKIRC